MMELNKTLRQSHRPPHLVGGTARVWYVAIAVPLDPANGSAMVELNFCSEIFCSYFIPMQETYER